MIVSDKGPATMKAMQAEITAAVKSFDWVTVRRLAQDYGQQLRSSTKLPASAETLVKLLLRNRQYDAVMDVADAALSVDPGNRQIWRDFAQALVDQGRTGPALRIFAEMADDPAASAYDRSEARGGVGRCYKELFRTAVDPIGASNICGARWRRTAGSITPTDGSPGTASTRSRYWPARGGNPCSCPASRIQRSLQPTRRHRC